MANDNCKTITYNGQEFNTDKKSKAIDKLHDYLLSDKIEVKEALKNIEHPAISELNEKHRILSEGGLVSGDPELKRINQQIENLKTKYYATPESQRQVQEGHQQAGVEEHPRAGTPREEKAPPETGDRNRGGDGAGTGEEKEVTQQFRQADTEEERKALGIEGHPIRGKTDEELESEANKAIKEGYDVPRLANDILSGQKTTLSDTERVILTKYAAEQQGKVENDPSDENVTNYANTIRALDRAGSEAGAALRSIQIGVVKDATLADALFREMDSKGVNTLTEAEKEETTKEWNDIQEAEKAWQDKYAQLQAENDKLRADAELKKERSKVKKATKKTSEDYSKERQKILEDLKEALKKTNRGEAALSSLPGVPQLIAIAPHVIKLTRSLLEEGVNKLDDVVTNIHSQLKGVIEGITEKDIHNIIAGDYASPSRTESQITQQMRDLRTQADLMNKLERLYSGETPKTEAKKRQRNQQIADLQRQIKDKVHADLIAKRSNEADAKKLDAFKQNKQKQIDELQKDLDEGNYVKDTKKEPLKLDKEGIDLRNQFIKLKQEREVRIAKQEYAKRTKLQKAGDIAKEIGNLPRAFKTAIDFSSVLRHGVVATFSHPIFASKAFPEMFRQAFSESRFNRWLYDLRESPEYETMQKSGLRISDPTRPEITAREEAFMSHLLHKIPLLGKYLKGNERAYTSYLNKMRVDIFNGGTEMLQQQGITFSKDPETYKALATFVNSATGSGTFGDKFDKAVPALNTVFFSPRLLASRLNLMNPLYYGKLPSPVRAMALRDMATWAAATTAIIGGMYLAGARITLNPISPDFLKGRFGKLRYDILGGFDSEIKFLAQMFKGKKADPDTGLMKKTNRATLFGNFLRSKLSPGASIAADFMYGKTYSGEKTTVKGELINQLPFAIDDTKDTWKDEGVKSILTTSLPSMFGVGVQEYSPKQKGSTW